MSPIEEGDVVVPSPYLDLTSDSGLLCALQDVTDALYDVAHLDSAGSMPGPILDAQYALVANGGDPLLHQEAEPTRGWAGDEAMLRTLHALVVHVLEAGLLGSTAVAGALRLLAERGIEVPIDVERALAA